MPLGLEQLPDFVEAVEVDYERNNLVDLTLNPRHKVAPRLLNKSIKNWKGGSKLNWKLKIASNNNARPTGLYDSDRSSRVSMLDSAEQGWAFYTTNYHFDQQEEVFGSDNPNVIIDYLNVQIDDMHEGMWERLEQDLWSAPTSSSQNPMVLAGIPFWIQNNGATREGAFNGGDPSGFAAGAGGVLTTTYSQWKNWTFAHDGTVTEDGFILRVVEAMEKAQFKSAHANSVGRLGGENDDLGYGLYTTYRMRKGVRKFLRSQNDNLGKDAAEMHKGNPLIMGNEVEEVPYLTENVSADDGTATLGDDPIYGLDWKKFKVFRQRGWWMKKHPLIRAAGSHNVWERHMDSHVNLACYDRRSGGFVGHYKA